MYPKIKQKKIFFLIQAFFLLSVWIFGRLMVISHENTTIIKNCIVESSDERTTYEVRYLPCRYMQIFD